MSTSGTFNYDPSLGELTLYAFHLCQVRPTELTQEHMWSARMSANMLQSRWSAQGVNLWAVDLITINLIAGQATYPIPASTIALLDGYTTTASGGASTNRVIIPMSRTEFASLASPSTQGSSSNYWYDRLIAPTVTFWPVPDGNEATASFYRLRQIQDATLTGGAQVEVPFLFLEAFALGLAHRLAIIWKPEKADGLKALADEAWEIASTRNIENVPIYVAPMLSGYFRS